jgi:hypothetical protein
VPLKHSKTPAAFKQNIRTEIAHGKPQKQAVAIAYSEKRRAEHRHNHADGGKVAGCPGCYDEGGEVDNSPGVLDKVEKYLNDAGASTGWQSQQNLMEPQHGPENKVNSASSARQYAEGGEVDEPSLHDMAADELMDALESKDKHRIKQCMRACMATMNEGDEDDGR